MQSLLLLFDTSRPLTAPEFLIRVSRNPELLAKMFPLCPNWHGEKEAVELR